MKKNIIFRNLFVLIILLLISKVVHAQEPYTVYNDGTLTFYYDENKESRGGMSVGQNGGGHFEDITTVVFDASFAKCTTLTSTAFWFSYCSNLTNITGISNLKTDNVTDMSGMFHGCSSLTSLDLSGFKTDNVTNMMWMFSGCSGLTSLDVRHFETGNVTRMDNMFYDCSSLTSLELSNFDTSNVTDMGYMFYECSGLTSLDVSGFKTDNVTNMYSMFAYCSGLTTLDVSGFKTDNVTSMHYMFYYCSGLTSLDVSGFKTDNVTDMYSMFAECSGLTSLDVSNFKTDNVTDMRVMFSGCRSLTSLDVSNFKTDNVTDMRVMFSGCRNLTSLDLSNFDTSNVTDMGSMFNGCSGLTTLDVSGFRTDNVTNMNCMFYGCSGLTTIFVGNEWSTTAEYLNSGLMFYECTSLVGGAGTTYNASHTDHTYARIDGGTDAPGYFTLFSSYGVTVGGVEVTSANASNITGTSIVRGTITFDNSTRTLTLDNVTIYNGGITSEGDLTIDLKGLNSVSAHHYIITGTNATMAPHLTFTTTDETTKLWLQPSWSGALIDGFGELSFENNLHVALGDLEGGGQALIATHIFSGGDGTADSPYLIGKYQDLNDLTDYVGNGLLKNVYYQLIADIDCPTQLRFYPIGYKKNIIISGENHVLEESFKGTFDGNNKTISNMTIYSTKKNYGEYAGMFGYVNGGTIKNLTLSNIKIQNDGAYSGGIAGYVEGGTIKNTLVTGESSVTATDYAGAIIGSNSDATLENNYYAISVTTETSTGSLMAYNHRGIGDEQYDRLSRDGAMLYNTHFVTCPPIMIDGNARQMSYVHNYYAQSGYDYLVVGGLDVILEVPNPGFHYTITVTNNTTNETIPITEEDSDNAVTTYSFTMPDTDVTVNVEIKKFDLWIGDTQVTEKNCKDILGDGNADQNKTASYQYVPDLNKLFITNNTDGLIIETNNDEGLTIYLAPNSTNSVGRIGYGGKGNAPLTITTDGNYPGNITLSANSNVISGFSSLTLEQNLVVMDPEDLAYDTNNWWLATTTATIGVPLTPITKEKTIKPDGNELKPEGGSNDVNKVVDDILYTLGNTNDNNEGDGYDDEGFVVINTVTTDQQAAEVTQNCTPGTNEYLEGFKGLTFMVPAGSGEIMFDMETPDGYAMKVMVGDAAPVIAEKHERDVFKIKYNVAEPTYVYAYNAGQISDANSARGIQKGKKTTVHIKVYSIKITPSKVKQSNSAAQASDGKYEGDVMGLEGQDIETDAEIEASRGDVNGDETTNVADIVGIVNAICGRHSATFDKRAADANGDGTVDATDIVIIVNKIMGK